MEDACCFDYVLETLANSLNLLICKALEVVEAVLRAGEAVLCDKMGGKFSWDGLKRSTGWKVSDILKSFS